MADGSRKQLGQVRVGEEVASWDSASERFVRSTVMATPTFMRRAEEIIEVELPHVRLHATQDHPFWSRLRRGLVSAHPNQTLQEYGLEAGALEAGDELEGPAGEIIRVSGLGPAVLSGRRLGGPGNATHVEVMTLCLQPFHWFHVHGVRVHNKGCFPGTTEISMANGMRKQLQDVQVGDEVVSWDEALRRPTISTVRATPAYIRHSAELVELELPHARLLATEDHPFWSHGRQLLVSARPNRTMEEYELPAAALDAGEALQDERGGGVRLASLRRPGPRALLSRRLRGNATHSEVRTLCLQPFHWFFAHGVRVHNKGGGCFPGATEITMASGKRKPLEEVKVGEEVVSWDEALQRPATSVVRAAPAFSRAAGDMVELRFHSGSLRATEDHPLWSRSRRSLVSARPNLTLQEYGLEAQALLAGEELEGETGEAVRVTHVHRPAAESLLQRRLGGLRNATDAQQAEVRVMTLCLHPHHWFYAHGVRVHNKGCFAPWVRVLLSNGTHAPISAIQASDRVVSWDADRDELSVATVLAVDAFPAGELLRAALPGNASAAEVAAGRRLGGPGGLVFTADHPVYSPRWRGPVSMRPAQTLAAYGLAVGQMLEREALRHHLGHDVEAEVRPWSGAAVVSEVMTLRLDRHHWFYAEGIRVHNKGGSYGGSRTRTITTLRSRSGFTSSRSYASWVLLSYTRRRRGYWVNNRADGCTYVEPDRPNATGGVQTVCQEEIGLETQCHVCDECRHDACIDAIPGCQQFVSKVYAGCYETRTVYDNGVFDGPINWVFLLAVLLFSICIAIVCCCTAQTSPKDCEQRRAQLRDQREELQASNSVGLGRVQLDGTYTENDETKPTTYAWQTDGLGNLKGETVDDDGRAQITGKIAWPQGADRGDMAWREERPGTVIEGRGTLALAGGQLTLEAEYFSNTGVAGRLKVMSRSQQAVDFSPGPSPGAEERLPLRNYAA